MVSLIHIVQLSEDLLVMHLTFAHYHVIISVVQSCLLSCSRQFMMLRCHHAWPCSMWLCHIAMWIGSKRTHTGTTM